MRHHRRLAGTDPLAATAVGGRSTRRPSPSPSYLQPAPIEAIDAHEQIILNAGVMGELPTERGADLRLRRAAGLSVA